MHRSIMKSFLVGIVLVLSLAVAWPSHAVRYSYYKAYQTTYYNIWYNPYSSTELNYAKGIAPYLDKAYKAALTVIGYDYFRQGGRLDIEFDPSCNGNEAFMYPGTTTVHLNTSTLSKYKLGYWGNAVAHETAHILFYKNTYAHWWNSSITGYAKFLTEALSWYAGDCVYGWWDGRSSATLSKSTIRSQVRSWADRTGYVLSWEDAGSYYGTSGSLGAQARWNLRAIGSFLTGDFRYSTSSKVRSLLTNLGNDLRNLAFGSSMTPWFAFENAFKKVYGKFANCDFRESYYRSTKYLYGDFYYAFYR